MAEFYSRSNLPTTIAQPKCEKIIPTYGKEVGKDGKVQIVETGKTNIYEKIQASKEDTLVYNILDRFNAGDVKALQYHDNVQYGDSTELPKTLVEWQQKYINAENYFNSLPLEVRRQFDHSVSDFLQTAVNGKLAERHAYFKAPDVVEDALKQVGQQQAMNNAINETVVQTPTVVVGGTNES